MTTFFFVLVQRRSIAYFNDFSKDVGKYVLPIDLSMITENNSCKFKVAISIYAFTKREKLILAYVYLYPLG